MFKKMFSFSNPLGLVFTAATLILTLSPEARRGTKKLLVKGAGAALALGDQMKGLTSGARMQLGTFMQEAREQKETMMIPDIVEMAKNTGSKIKNTFVAGTEAVDEGIEKVGFDHTNDFSIKEKGLFDDIEPAVSNIQNEFTAYNVLNDQVIQNKLNEIDHQFH